MRSAWDWLLLRLPFVVHTRRGLWLSEKNAFDLGRDYERGVQSGKVPQ